MRSRASCSPARTLTFNPERRATSLARFATSSGDFAPAGSLTRSRAHRTAAATREPRASPAFTLALVRPSTTTRVSFDAGASPLYLRNWYEPRWTPSASACAAAPRSSDSGAASSNGGRDPRHLGAPLRERGAGAPDRVEVERVLLADADEDDGLGAELALGRHGQRLAALAVEVGFLHELGEVTAERGGDDLGAGTEAPIGEDRNGEEVGAHLVGGGGAGLDGERCRSEWHGAGVYGFRRPCLTT